MGEEEENYMTMHPGRIGVANPCKVPHPLGPLLRVPGDRLPAGDGSADAAGDAGAGGGGAARGDRGGAGRPRHHVLRPHDRQATRMVRPAGILSRKRQILSHVKRPRCLQASRLFMMRWVMSYWPRHQFRDAALHPHHDPTPLFAPPQKGPHPRRGAAAALGGASGLSDRRSAQQPGVPAALCRSPRLPARRRHHRVPRRVSGL
jgi:hypothetical protein